MAPRNVSSFVADPSSSGVIAVRSISTSKPHAAPDAFVPLDPNDRLIDRIELRDRFAIKYSRAGDTS